MRPLFNAQGGHELYHIPTKRMITRCRVTIIPMPQEVIDLIDAQGKAQGMSGIKITNRQGQLLFDSARLAGVEDTPNEYEEDEEELLDKTEEEDEIDPNDLAEILHDESSQAESTEEDQDPGDTREVEPEEETNDDTLEVEIQEPR